LGLDIYVGSFTRYYAGDWELIALFRRHALLSVTYRLPFLLDW
jgi:hypothetical protein